MPTFKISDVKPDRPVDTVRMQDLSDSFKGRYDTVVEACGANCDRVLAYGLDNGFLGAIHTAYDFHYDLCLTPDDVWLAIAMGFANHVNAHAEELRSMFVAHEGKEDITIRRDFFRKGNPNNDWPGCFDEFSDEIAKHIGEEKRSLIVSDFSTTGPLERAVSGLVLMNAMKAYFAYGVHTCCGIPSITLSGTLEDWVRVRDKALGLAKFQCVNWINVLVPVLNQFIEAYQGHVDTVFWRAMYKRHGGSGGPWISGWIHAFFPYLVGDDTKLGDRPNPYMAKCLDNLGEKYSHGGATTDEFPLGICKVPFKWFYYEQTIEMLFYGGFVGTYLEDTRLRPVIGWGVGEAVQAADRGADPELAAAL